MSTSFFELCNTIQQIRETRGTNAKITILADFLSHLDTAEDLELATQFIGEGAFAAISGKRASVGSRTAGLAASGFCEIDYDKVYKPCRTATGSNSEAIERLLQNIPSAIDKRAPVDLSLQDVSGMFHDLLEVSSRVDKIELLQKIWRKMHPVEVKYFIRMLGQGSLRIGFETKSVIASIAKAFDYKKESVRYAHMITGSIGKTAVLARDERLDEAEFKLFHPLSFMLASPIESRSVDTLSDYIAEEKFDGMRAQVHHSEQKVEVYSRDLNEVTRSFPEIQTFFKERTVPEIVLDGEICVYYDEKIQPFQLLQKRMGLKKPSQKILKDLPVLFIAYDLLYMDGSPVFDLPIEQRRNRLETLSKRHRIPLSNQFELNDTDVLDDLFDRAIAHGNEGLMLKKRGSGYEYG